MDNDGLQTEITIVEQLAPVRFVVSPLYDADLYGDFLQQALPPETDKQIKKDLLRTMPSTSPFGRDGVGLEPLRRVLHAFALYDEEIGYVQGLNFYAATLLTYMNEEGAFWALVTLFRQRHLRGMMTPGFPGLHSAVQEFGRLLKKALPKLAAHFASLGVTPALLESFTNVYQTLFASTLRPDVTPRVWDMIFLHG